MIPKEQLKVGDRVRDKYNGFTGVVVDVWDGKYMVSYYDGEQFNPYRITVCFGQDHIKKFGDGIIGNGTVTKRAEHLEKV